MSNRYPRTLHLIAQLPALLAFGRALRVHPHLAGVRDTVHDLRGY